MQSIWIFTLILQGYKKELLEKWWKKKFIEVHDDDLTINTDPRDLLEKL